MTGEVGIGFFLFTFGTIALVMCAVQNFLFSVGEFSGILYCLAAFEIRRCHTVILSVNFYMILTIAAYFRVFFCSHTLFRAG